MNLKNYISHIMLGDSVVVEVTILGSLRDGSNSNQNVISTSFGQSISLTFTKNGDLISKCCKY